MSSDYIPRLRAELLRAEASRQTRRRPLHVARPLAFAAAAALVVLALVLVAPGSRDDDGALETAAGLTYRVEPATAAEQTAQNLRARIDAAGVKGAEVTVSGGRLTITAPAAAQAAIQALAVPGRFGIYDWERSVLGPRGEPAPTDPDVTGGIDPGRSGSITEAEARARGGLAVHDGGRWFALGGEPGVTGAGVERAAWAIDPQLRGPTVRLDLTASGERAFTELTREVSRQGADVQENQHIALVLDDRLFSVPFIDWQQAPDGIDGAQGAQISDVTEEEARQITAILNAGPLPGTLSR